MAQLKKKQNKSMQGKSLLARPRFASEKHVTWIKRANYVCYYRDLLAKLKTESRISILIKNIYYFLFKIAPKNEAIFVTSVTKPLFETPFFCERKMRNTYLVLDYDIMP